MRTFAALVLLSALPFSMAFAADSEYHHAYFGDTTDSPHNTMEYWDGGGARNMLMGSNLLDDKSSGLGSSLSRYSNSGTNLPLQDTTGFGPNQCGPAQMSLLHANPQILNSPCRNP